MGYEDEELDDVQALLQAITFGDRATDFCDTLRVIGFQDVHAEKVPLPEHIKSRIEPDENPGTRTFWKSMASREHEYWRIRTSQGTFGYLWSGFALLDLRSTGIAPEQLVSQLACVPPYLCVLGNTDVLERLVVLMERK